MKRSQQNPPPAPAAASVAEQLDTLNARTRAARDAPNVLRRTIEARIEEKTKRRPNRETGAASRWKGSA